MAQFENKIVVVTGGTQGLGAATATLLGERGAKGLVICGRSEEKGAAQAARLAALGTEVVFVKADLSNVDDCKAVIAAADSKFGRLDSLVNAAGMTNRGTILSTSPELFDQLFAVNIRAPFFLMQGAIELFKREGIAGTIVNISTMSSMGGQPFLAAYSASKGALDTLTPQYGLRRSAQPDPREQPQYRLDGVRGRGQDATRTGWPASRLARKGGCRSAEWPPY